MARRSRFSVERAVARNEKHAGPTDWVELEQEWRRDLAEKEDYIRAACVGGHCHYRLCLRGLHQVLDGDVAGWSAVRTGIACENWLLYVRFKSFDACTIPIGKRGSIPGYWGHELIGVTFGIAFASLVGWDRCAKMLGDRLARSARDADPLVAPPDDWSSYSGFPGFVLRLYTMESGQGSPDVPPPCGDYEAIFECWNDDEKLARAIETACGAHCEWAENEDRTFWMVPQAVVPVEFAYLAKVRAGLGLRTPHVDHPLLTSPLASIPPDTGSDLGQDTHGQTLAKTPKPQCRGLETLAKTPKPQCRGLEGPWPRHPNLNAVGWKCAQGWAFG